MALWDCVEAVIEQQMHSAALLRYRHTTAGLAALLVPPPPAAASLGWGWCSSCTGAAGVS
eukprot:CAMPEP_0117676662 /NCGR_PEP_ID=MMETSP0804-20121206/16309_1 /TAXON_ID=1074897 /ORGANISM="Tetraselmis astigmatica, Strain CCMP880" /LENGTH=59 /DNA_ID=CAMNT_0005485849 /DNA_START=46 /DNA_END=222 /DNA_ORIENTATION=-